VQFLRDVICFLRGIFRGGSVSSMTANPHADYFVERGCEYYATARFAMHAQRPLICGNLFHHCIEMLLKGGLAKRGKTLTELEDMRHSLKKLWRAYKNEHPEAQLERHNKTIKKLDRLEEIRYPNSRPGSIGVSLE
jgi:hypothetical protein